MKAVVEYNRQRDSFQVIDKEHGVIPVDFDTEAEAWDFVLDCESEEREREARLEKVKEAYRSGRTHARR